MLLPKVKKVGGVDGEKIGKLPENAGFGGADYDLCVGAGEAMGEGDELLFVDQKFARSVDRVAEKVLVEVSGIEKKANSQ